MNKGDDLIRFVADGANSYFIDEYSIGKWKPKADDSQDLTGSFSGQGNEIVFQVQRKLDTGDTENDFLIPLDLDFDMAWAAKTGTSNKDKRHSQRRGMTGSLKSNGNPTWGEPLQSESADKEADV